MDVQRDGAVRVEVVARTIFGVEHRNRLGGANDVELLIHIIRTTGPDRRTTGAPRYACRVGPGLVTRFAGAGNRVEAPSLGAIGEGEALYPTTGTGVTRR